MSADNELDQILNTTHQYRKQLDEIQRRNGSATQAVVDDPFKTTGEQRAKLEAMDADLTALELRKQLAETRKRVEQLEAVPQFDTRATARTSGDEGVDISYRWLRALATNDKAELRVLTKSSTSNAPVPTDMERRIVNKMYQASVLRQISNVQTINSNRTITVEGSTPSAALVDENGSISPADFTFKAISVVPRKIVAATTMTQEFIDDAIGSGDIGTVVNWAAERFGISLARESDKYYTYGNPNASPAEPQGIGSTQSTAWATTNSSNIINQGVALTEDQTVANISADNIIDCVHAVAPQYRMGARWRVLTSDACIKAIRKLKVNNDYIWMPGGSTMQQGIAVGVPGTIYGVPYAIGEYVPSTAAQTGTGTNVRGSALFIVGNFDYFSIFDRTGLETMTDPYSGAANLRTTLYLWLRTDSRIVLPEAFAAIYSPNAS